MKRPDLDPRSVLWTLGALAALGAAGGAAIVGLGLYNTSAKSGHWPGVSPILHTTFRNSVDLRAPPAEDVPALTGEMAALGARHFEAACAHCHAAPGREATATMRSMLPQPPRIEAAVDDWTPAELQWILHEGVKMSGMPAWPVARPEEVWPVVAFLVQVQEGMDADGYDRLVALPEEGGTDFDYCASCHGERGATSNPDIPRLDILSQAYLTMTLDAYLDRERASGIMQHAASEVSPERLPALAARFAEVAPQGEPAPPEGDARAGRAIAYAETGSRVPSCRACHGPWPEEIDETFPSLAGQNETYLRDQLHLWRAGERGEGRVAGLMTEAARLLGDDDIEAVAAYYAGLRPAELNGTEDLD